MGFIGQIRKLFPFVQGKTMCLGIGGRYGVAVHFGWSEGYEPTRRWLVPLSVPLWARSGERLESELETFKKV